MRNRSKAMMVALLAPTTAPLWAGNGVWTGNGPDGGRIFEIAISPSAAELYASSNGGVYKSSDGGLTWARAENGLVGSTAWAPSIVLDNTTPTRLYLSDGFGRIYRTDNGATDWLPSTFSIDPLLDRVNDMAISPSSGLKLAAVTRASSLHISADGGVSFTNAATGLPPFSTPLYRVAFDRRDAMRLLVGTDFSTVVPSDPQPPTIYTSGNGGANFLPSYTFPAAPGNSIGLRVNGFGFGGPGLVTWAATSVGLLRSPDGGNSWNGVSWAGAPSAGGALAVVGHPSDANTLWLVGPEGVHRSTNSGGTWTPLNNGLQPVVSSQATITSLTLHPNYPTTPTLWATSEFSGIYVSVDDGANWAPSHSGLAATTIRALVVHPNNRNLVYAGFGDAFSPSPVLYRSVTADITSSITWTTSSSNLLATQIRGLALDPTTAGSLGATHLYASGRACVSSFPSACFSPRNGGVYKSINSGASWNTIDNGLPLAGPVGSMTPNVGTVRALALDPRSCSAPPPTGPCASGPLQTLYFTATGRNTNVSPGVWTTAFRIGKSIDGGANWTESSNGLPAPVGDLEQLTTPAPIIVDPLNPQTLYVGTFTGYELPPAPPPTIPSGVFKSINGGVNWVHASDGLPRASGSANTVLDVLSLAIHPTNPQILWASATQLAAGSGAPGAIYKTTTGAMPITGPAWQLSNGGVTMPDVRVLLVDPTNPNTIYAGGAGSVSNPGGVYKSLDGGANWTSISTGLPADAASSLALDPVDPRLIHAGTASGVFSILQLADADLDGVPDVTENAVPNGSVIEGSGDGNNDGTADRFQGDVGSSVIIYKAMNVWTKGLTGQPDKNVVAGPVGGFFTTDIIGAQSTGDCDQAYDVHAPIAGSFGLDRNPHGRPRAYPHETIRMEIPGCQHATIDITFHLADFAGGRGWSFRAYAPTTPGDDSSIRWFDFSARASLIGPKKWRIVLDAGQQGSYRPGNNAILFVGGPAYDEQIFASGFEVPPPPN